MTTIPILVPPLITDSQEEFADKAYTMTSSLPDFANGANALAEQVSQDAANAAAAVSALANDVWVSGTTYAIGDVVYSPTDYLNYRRITNGAGTTDPVSDTTNWLLITSTSVGGSDTTSSAVDITLTATSGRLQVITMTASGKKATLPAANTLKKGTPLFVIKNSGYYRFAVHKYGGSFLCYVNPGQVIAFHCSDISTGAGVWYVSGGDVDQVYSGNTEEVLNAVDSRYIAVAMLTSTKAICAFRNNSTTYLNAVVVNYGSASGTPSAINAEASLDISIAAQTSTQATVVYKTSTGATKAYVLDVSGTTITPGSVASVDAGTGGSGTSITALSSTQLLCAYQGGAAGTPRMRVFDISGSTITASSEVAADATAAAATYIKVRKISSSKAVVAFRNNTGNKPQIRLQSITGSTPAPTGSVLDISATPGTTPATALGIAVMSSSRAVLVAPIDRSYGDLMISLLDISGTSATLVRNKIISVGSNGTVDADAIKIDSNTVYATWTGGGSLGSDAIVIRITSDDKIVVLPVADQIEASVEASPGYLAADALDSTHVVQLCRNASTYLSAKVVEIAA